MSLNSWLSEYLTALVSFFLDEYDWCQQIFSNKYESTLIMRELIESIFDELMFELRDWINIFLFSNIENSDTMNRYQHLQFINKIVSLYNIFNNQFFCKIYNCRLMSLTPLTAGDEKKSNDNNNNNNNTPATSPRSKTNGNINTRTNAAKTRDENAFQLKFCLKGSKNDSLGLLKNVVKLIKSLLQPYYNGKYLNSERRLLFSIFEKQRATTNSSGITFNNDISTNMNTNTNTNNALLSPTRETVAIMDSIRWIHENALNELSFIEICERIDDSLKLVLKLLNDSSERCLMISYAGLIQIYFNLIDSFITNYISKLLILLKRSNYHGISDNSNNVSLQIDTTNFSNDNSNQNQTIPADGSAKNNSNDPTGTTVTGTPRGSRDMSNPALASIAAAAMEDKNWILDLKESFKCLVKIEELKDRLAGLINDINIKYIRGVSELHDENSEDGNVLFFRVFSSTAQLQLLSKYRDFSNTLSLFPKCVKLTLLTVSATSVVDKSQGKSKSNNKSGVSGISSPPNAGGNVNDNFDLIICQALLDTIEKIVLNVMMHEIHKSLKNVSKLKVWTQNPSKKNKALGLPQFHLQPNEYIRSIGSHLLALVQQLESAQVHTTTTTLTSPQMGTNKTPPTKKTKQDDPDDLSQFENNDDDDENKAGEDDNDSDNDDENGDAKEVKKNEDNDNDDNEIEEYIDSEHWLNMVLDATVKALFEEFYKLNSLGLKGTKQLIADLAYLNNMANALYVNQSPFVNAILIILQCKLGESHLLKERLVFNDAPVSTASNGDNDNQDEESMVDQRPRLRNSFEKKIATKFAVLRQLNVRFV